MNDLLAYFAGFSLATAYWTMDRPAISICAAAFGMLTTALWIIIDRANKGAGGSDA